MAQQQDQAFLKLSERSTVATLEEALCLFFDKSGVSERTIKMRTYLLWFRYATDKEAMPLEKWSRALEDGRMVGKSLYISTIPPQHTNYIRELVSDFVAKKINQKYHIGVAYAIYYLISLLLMAEIISDEEIGETLLRLQCEITPTLKREEFIAIIEEMAIYFSAYLLQ